MGPLAERPGLFPPPPDGERVREDGEDALKKKNSFASRCAAL